MKPRARREGLVVKELPEEVLVYDRERHKAHCLNPAAALVFKHADGRRSVAQLARTLRDELGVAADEEWVHLALDRLRRAHLLETPAAAELQSSSRRALLKRLGAAAAVLPAVTSVLAPTPAQAANTCIPAAQCIAGNPQPCYNSTPDNCANPSCFCTGNGVCAGGSGC